jgi:hypothetical protein
MGIMVGSSRSQDLVGTLDLAEPLGRLLLRDLAEVGLRVGMELADELAAELADRLGRRVARQVEDRERTLAVAERGVRSW